MLALDQGTTSSRAILFDHDGSIRSIAQREFEQDLPAGGMGGARSGRNLVFADQCCGGSVEPGRCSTSRHCGNRYHQPARDDGGVGSGDGKADLQRDRVAGPANCWIVRPIKNAGHEKLIQERTGLLVDSYFSATKIRWILDHVAAARRLADAGRLAFGTIDSWLIWKLTSGKLHITDVSNASRTMLFNIHRCEWDEELLRLLEIPRSLLPEVRASSEVYSEVTTTLGLGSIPIAGIAGDQQASLFGQRCTSPGLAKNTYGTGCFLLQNTGRDAVPSKNRLVTTVAWKIGDAVEYALEGSVFIGGAVVQWLRDGLHVIHNSNEVEALANSVSDNGGVYWCPRLLDWAHRTGTSTRAGRSSGLRGRRLWAPGTSGFGEHCVPGRGCIGCDATGRGHSVARVACRWRGGGQRDSVAFPGGCSGDSGGASCGDGDDGFGSSVHGGDRNGFLA